MKKSIFTALIALSFICPTLLLAQSAPDKDPEAATDGASEGGAPLEVGGDAAEVETEKDPFNLLVITLNTKPAAVQPGSQGEQELLKAAQEQNLPEAYFNLGIVYVRAGMLDRAWGYFQKTLEVSPDFCEAMALQGVIEISRGKAADGEALINKAVEVNKYCSPARNYLARKSIADGNFDEAIRHCRIALLGDPSNTNVYLNLALAYFRKGNLELADFVIKEGLVHPSSKAPLLNFRGIVALKRNDVRAAFRYFEQAYANDPGYVDALKNLAAVELNYKSYDTALARIDEYLKLDPENLAFRMSRAVALRGLGRLDDAKAQLKALRAANPKNFEIAYNECILFNDYVQDWKAALEPCANALSLISKGHNKFSEMTRRVGGIQDTLKFMQDEPPQPDPGKPGAPPDTTVPEESQPKEPEEKPAEKPAPETTGDGAAAPQAEKPADGEGGEAVPK